MNIIADGTMAKKKIGNLHLDIYEDEQELEERIKRLKTRSGVKTDAEFMRWALKQLDELLKERDEYTRSSREYFKIKEEGT